ncbi:MAG: PSD1 and planctomycete cytochrome C domain-containing protein [Planctomycetota bacterium]|nr:PSD1 and planctomycete cytochrome C domain-containing protein [Planctomycetota bacterium]
MTTFLMLFGLFGAEPENGPEVAFFEKRIRPVLVEHCYRCHSSQAKIPKGGLRLDSRAAIRRGGENGPAVVPGDSAASLLIQALRHETFEMPPDRKLPDRVINDFVAWIGRGAVDPRDHPPTDQASTSWPEVVAQRRKIWSLQPVTLSAPPSVTDPAWSGHAVDRFVKAALDQAGLQPAPLAGRYALLRRVSLALTGLPPAREQIEAFVDDRSVVAYERLVDRLLASPHFGERWARHWLDVVRFAETYGHEWNGEVRGAWRYRDYVVRCWNQDVPYDQVVREHIAGDLLASPRFNPVKRINESLLGTAFYRFGEVGHDDCLEFREISLDVIDNQIDTLSKAFLATTMSCARCHDHKLDPVSTREYYALSGILSSTRFVARTIDQPDVNDAAKSQLQMLKSQIRQELARQWLQDVQRAEDYLSAAQLQSTAAADTAQTVDLDPQRLKNWVAALKVFDKKVPPLEHPLHAWCALRAKQELAAEWSQLKLHYQREQEVRSAFNAEHFEEFVDFRNRLPASQNGEPGWRGEGLGWDDAFCRSGEFAIAHEGDPVVRSVFRAGMYTHKFSDRLNGALRSSFLPKDRKYLSVEVLGGGESALRTIYDNCHLGLDSAVLNSDELQWMTKSTRKQYVDSHVYVALVTKFDNQSYPKYNTQHVIDHTKIRSHFGVTRAVLHDCEGPPRTDLAHLLPLFTEPAAPGTISELAAGYGRVIRQAVQAWAEDQASDEDVRWLAWLLSSKILSNTKAKSDVLADLVARYREIEGQIPPPKIINAMADLDPGFDAPLRVRGDPFQLGTPVPRRFLEVLEGSDASWDVVGSGRRRLADVVASADNPLTARVMVNRIWHHLFGHGLVRTTDDFGALGDRPSHPQLLDYLAVQFVRQGWSLKRLIRSLVLTRTYRAASRVNAGAREVDPENRLLHHFPLRRLEAEAIRDTMLAVAGNLSRDFGGRSIHPYRVQERKDRRLFAGPLDGRGRRSLYTKMTLTEEPPFLTVFNLPEPKQTRGRRDVTSVPAQALALLNDPFVNQQAAVWTESLLMDGGDTVAARIDGMFLAALGRRPASTERQRFEILVNRLAALHQVRSTDLLTSAAVWRDVAHAMFNLKEFIYIR